MDENNRWIILSKLIPGNEFEKEYASLFDKKLGAPAKYFRLSFGLLLIQLISRIILIHTLNHQRQKNYGVNRQQI